MIIWRYMVPLAGGAITQKHGTPVEVYVPAKGYVQLVYQFGDVAPPAVVDHPTGRVVCYVPRGCDGPYQEQARKACAAFFESLRAECASAEAWHARIAQAFGDAAVLNEGVQTV